ncbi:MAG: hypothetical protein OEY80_13035 [Nitrospirota bacterium]|nr:hypothetical protein [Nitrospirota bacterium]MDH4360302.1 hypothetical protein [Nitrospirota bacterium]MDH5296797.1 hypothetical protein [Nitrospirota bacterium]MDH5576403.1 hypothetical protein [Nitrospirota bacterium]
MPLLLSLLMCILLLPSLSFAEWKVSGESNVYYTDDAALFSATRRLARLQDPTQPVIDSKLANQGNDVVFEPVAQIGKSFSLMGRQTRVVVRGQGFVFTNNTRFSHGSLGVQASHNLTPSTSLIFRYFFGPDLFLGKNEVRPIEESGGDPPRLKNEEVTTHYWAGGIAQQIPGVDDARVILYGRYGLREYDKPFTERDTRFWTIGTHVEWPLTEKIGMALGYHYERGLADGRKQPELKDDISYYNHFVTGELEFEFTESIGVEMALHYEFNGWTTGISEDERKGQHENVIQGDIAARYRVNEVLQVTAGFQGSHRKESFEAGLKNLNTWLGAKLAF